MECKSVLPESSDKSNIPSAVVVFVVVVCSLLLLLLLFLLFNLATSESSDKSNIPPAGTNSTFHSLQIFYTLPNV